jgi:hypothetical protein
MPPSPLTLAENVTRAPSGAGFREEAREVALGLRGGVVAPDEVR